MASSDENNHDFFEVLSGRKKGNTTAEALRKALIDEALAIKQVEDNPPKKLTESELAHLEVVKQELIKKGVFRPQIINQNGFIYYIAALQNYLTNHFLQILKLASVPAILIVTFLIYHINQNNSNLSDIEHTVKNNINNSSVGAIYISENYTESDIDKLKNNLKDAGAEVVETQISGSERLLEVSVPVKTKIDAIKTLLVQAGVKINGEPPYKVTVQSK